MLINLACAEQRATTWLLSQCCPKVSSVVSDMFWFQCGRPSLFGSVYYREDSSGGIQRRRVCSLLSQLDAQTGRCWCGWAHRWKVGQRSEVLFADSCGSRARLLKTSRGSMCSSLNKQASKISLCSPPQTRPPPGVQSSTRPVNSPKECGKQYCLLLSASLFCLFVFF